MNKHGFAHLDIKRENIVLDPLREDTVNLLFLPLGQGRQEEVGEPSVLDEAIQVSSTAAAAIR